MNASSQRPLHLSRAQGWLLLFGLFTLLALLTFGYVYLDDLTRQRPGTLGVRLLEQLTGVYSAFLLLPFIFRYSRFVFGSRLSWIGRLALHFAGAIVYSLAHTSMMALSRWTLAPIVGLGHYDYGIMRFRYPMEFSNDVISYAMIIAIVYFYDRLRLAQAQQLAAAELQTKLTQSQLENLRLQVQPHFLFNTLNTISTVMYEDIRTADAMISQLSDLLRLTLRSSNANEVSLEEELQITRCYLELMQRRFESKLCVSYNIDNSLLSTFVPQLVLQPLVENSIRHGMKSSGEAMMLAISAQREDASLILRVADSGAGFSPSSTSTSNSNGIGLANIRGRLAQLYGSNAELSLQNRSSGGAEVAVRLPIHLPPQPSYSAR